ncbi:MAG: hypothetical protein AAF628_21875 [Planctomycetota bacterium]
MVVANKVDQYAPEDLPALQPFLKRADESTTSRSSKSSEARCGWIGWPARPVNEAGTTAIVTVP